MSNQKKNNLRPHEKLRELREGLDITQTELAHRLGMSQAAYHRLESGIRAFTFNDMAKIADEFGIAPGYFIESRPIKVIVEGARDDVISISLSGSLLKRIKEHAISNNRLVHDEVILTLEKAYPYIPFHENINEYFKSHNIPNNEQEIIMDYFITAIPKFQTLNGKRNFIRRILPGIKLPEVQR